MAYKVEHVGRKDMEFLLMLVRTLTATTAFSQEEVERELVSAGDVKALLMMEMGDACGRDFAMIESTMRISSNNELRPGTVFFVGSCVAVHREFFNQWAVNAEALEIKTLTEVLEKRGG